MLLDRGAQLLTDVAGVVANQKGNLDCDLKTLELVTDAATTPARLAGLRSLVRVGPVAFARVWDARDVDTTGPYPGVWLRVGFVANPVHNPPAAFVPTKDVPAVKAVAPCQSPLLPSGVNYVVSTRAVPEGPSAPMTALVALLLAAAAAALVVREAGWR